MRPGRATRPGTRSRPRPQSNLGRTEAHGAPGRGSASSRNGGRRREKLLAERTGFLIFILREAVDAERPLNDPLGPGSGPSFPSAHGASWAALVTAVVLLTGRPRRLVVAVAGGALVLAIGASRVYLAAHHPRDVVAGLALGAGWACLVAWAAGRRSGARARGGS